jgi:hypothetical protein
MVTHPVRRRSARARSSGRRAADSPVMAMLARAGLAARGTMYILIGIIAVEIAIGASHQQADRDGAVRIVAATPFGSVLLWLLVAGFAGMTLWRLSEAAFGEAGSDGRKASKRLANLARGVFYGFVTFGILKFALGIGSPSSSDKDSRDLTATALHYPGGQAVVAIVGLTVIGGGCYIAYRAFKAKFLKHLQLAGTTATTRKAVKRLGQIGGGARGIVFCTVGIFLVIAAFDEQPDKAKGIDSALRELAHTPLGPWLLILVAVGLVVFGLYSFCEARWREVGTR